MDLTGVVCDIYMCEWDKGVIAGVEESHIRPVLYKRYKDDVNTVLEASSEEVVVSSRVVMEHVRMVADGVDANLKVTVDSKDNHIDGKVPTLDLKVWIADSEQNSTKVLYDHYMKEVASRATIHYRSSHSMEMKRNVAMNEIMRIFCNCSENIPWTEAAKFVMYYMQRLQFSGYPREF